MKVVLIILSIIGLLRVVSLFILCIVEIYYRIKKEYINGIKRTCGMFINDMWYIIPTISVAKSNQYFEVIVNWLCFQYYSSYYVDKDEDES